MGANAVECEMGRSRVTEARLRRGRCEDGQSFVVEMQSQVNKGRGTRGRIVRFKSPSKRCEVAKGPQVKVHTGALYARSR